MKIRKDWNHKKTIIGGFAVSGVVFVLAIIVMLLMITPLGGKKSAKAVVDSVSQINNNSVAIIHFSVDDKIIQTKYPGDASNLAYQDEVTIYYKINAPEEVSTLFPAFITPILLLTISIGIFSIVIYSSVTIKKIQKKINYIKENGEKYQGKVIELSISDNKKIGYVICSFESNSEMKLLYSEMVEFINNKEYLNLPVDIYYINDDEYFIDLSKYQ